MQYALLFYNPPLAQVPERQRTTGRRDARGDGRLARGARPRRRLPLGAQARPGGVGDLAPPGRRRVLVTDGPFADTKEMLGGLAVIDCADLDEALGLARARPPRGWARSRCGRSLARPLMAGAAAGPWAAGLGRRRGREALAAVVRGEAGLVLASLIAPFGDFDLAEDAFQDAVATALERWPRDGVPGGLQRGSRWRRGGARSTGCATSDARGQGGGAARERGAAARRARDARRPNPCRTSGCACSSRAATRRCRPRRAWRYAAHARRPPTEAVARAFLLPAATLAKRLDARSARSATRASPTACRPSRSGRARPIRCSRSST